MILPPKSFLSFAIVDADLFVVRVVVGPRAPRVTHSQVIERFLSLSDQDAKVALRPFAQTSGRALLTAPSSWCSVRPIALTTRDWPKAKAEIMRSIDRLVPMTPDDALVGLVNLYDDSLTPVAGRLIAIHTRSLDPWRHAIEAALDRPIAAVLSPHMAMLGLGLQDEPHTLIIEPDPAGQSLQHELTLGLPTSIAEPPDLDSNNTQTNATVLPGSDAASTVTGAELAVASALASLAAPNAFAPLDGRTPSRRIEWLAPAAALIAAAALFIAAPMIFHARFRAGIERSKAQQSALVEPFNTVRDLRHNAEKLARQLNEGVAATTASWHSVLPALAQAQASLPADGFLNRLSIDDQSVTISGDASDTPAILQRLEASDALTSARRTGPLSPSSFPGLDHFEMRAARTNPGVNK